VIDEAALKRIREAERARDDAIQVDEFDPQQLGHRSPGEADAERYRPESAINPSRAR